MNRHPIALAALLIAGCASTGPAGAPSSGAYCEELAAGVTASEEARSAALEKQQSAWKAVFPVLVAARYATAQVELSDADQRGAELKREAAQRGCKERA